MTQNLKNQFRGKLRLKKTQNLYCWSSRKISDPSGKWASSSYSNNFRSSSQKWHGNSSQWDKGQGINKCLSKETHSRTLLQKFQENEKNFNILFKRNKFLRLDNQSKIHRHLFLKTLSTKKITKFSSSKENKVFSRELDKVSRRQNILQIAEDLKLDFLRTIFPESHSREIPTPQDQKILVDAEIN